uniref:MoaD/ThiS family protein n=1 Tax=Desulfacinum infernum TaxID=35837 RepID=A0A832A0B4_9BACT
MDFKGPLNAWDVCRVEIVDGDALGAFFPWFQSGLWILVPSGTTVAKLLAETWRLSPEKIHRDVGTVFRNGIPVDCLEATDVSDGDVLALSGPMPGLAGAILRKNSPLAGLRHSARAVSSAASAAGQTLHRIQVKLFNRLIEDVGPVLLKGGIELERAAALQCLRDWQASERRKPERVLLNGADVPFAEAAAAIEQGSWRCVAFIVRLEPPSA